MGSESGVVPRGPRTPARYPYATTVLIYRETRHYGGLYHGTLGVHERAQKVLALAHHYDFIVCRHFNRAHTRVCSGALYLYPVLNSRPCREWYSPGRLLVISRSGRENGMI
jgi:hypothetical protein